MKKRIPPLVTMLIGLIFYLLGFYLFKGSLTGALFELSFLIFFLIALAGMIGGRSKSKKDAEGNGFEKNKLNNNTKTLIIVLLSVFILGLIYYAQKIIREDNLETKINKVNQTEFVAKDFAESQAEKTAGKPDPTIDVNKNSSVNATSITVGTFYDGQDGFSLSIPSGNKSTCIWTYNAGSGRVPYSLTTDAITATEKHTISVYGEEEDLKVTCVDDFGNNYIGIFPEPDYENIPTSNQVDQEIDKSVWENL